MSALHNELTSTFNETRSHVFLEDKCVLYFANEELGDDEYIIIVTLSRRLATNETTLLKVMSKTSVWAFAMWHSMAS